MAGPTNTEYSVSLKVSPEYPEPVVSDGKAEVTIRCAVKDAKGRPVKYETEVTFKIPRAKFLASKKLRRGAATIKYRPTRPTGKTLVRVTTPYGEATQLLRVTPTTTQALKDNFFTLLWAVAIIFLIVRPFIVQTFFIPSDSMEPTFYRGDRLIGPMFIYRFTSPKHGDIVIFKSNDKYTYKIPLIGPVWTSHKNYIKRVIAVEGDTIDVLEGKTYINDQPLDEPYIKSPPRYFTERPFTVPKGKLIVLGDNRNNSRDCHVWENPPDYDYHGIVHKWGTLDVKDVKARAVFLFWPPDRLSTLPRPAWAKNPPKQKK